MRTERSTTIFTCDVPGCDMSVEYKGLLNRPMSGWASITVHANNTSTDRDLCPIHAQHIETMR